MDGYGIYLKIENDIEGSLLAHNKEILVNLNQRVVEGQEVCVSNNTGFSTGPHCHWGYFRKPRDRTNGFNGYIDPIPYFDGSVIISPSTPVMEITDQTKIPQILDDNGNSMEVQQVKSELLAKDQRIKELEGSLTNCMSANNQQAILLKESTDQLNNCLSRPTEAPKNASEAFKLLLHYIFK